MAAARELRGDVGLEIREGEHKIGLERLDLVEARIDEGGYPRLLSRLRRAHRVPRHTGNAIALAEEIERLRRFLGEAHDPRRVFHALEGPTLRSAPTIKSAQTNGATVCVSPISSAIASLNIGPA